MHGAKVKITPLALYHSCISLTIFQNDQGDKYLQNYDGETSQKMCILNITDMRDGEKLIRIVSMKGIVNMYCAINVLIIIPHEYQLY
jgi:hypothetical protein